MKLSPGQQKIQMLREGGFSEDDIGTWKEDTTKTLVEGGFGDKQIDDYFGTPEFDPTYVKDTVSKNIENSAGELKVPIGEVNEVDTFMEAVTSGLQTSVAGLAIRGKNPDVHVTGNTSAALSTVSGLTTAAADFLPSVVGSVGGSVLGAVAGTPLGPVGTVSGAAVGGLAGAGALPEALRSSLMHYYDSRSVETFSDFWRMAKDVIADSSKAALLNVVGAGAGKLAGSVAKPLAKSLAGKAAQETIKIASEATAMETLGAKLEDRAPTLNGIIQMGTVIGGAKAAGVAAKQLRKAYSETGILPEEMAALVEEDSSLKQKLFSNTKEQYGPPEPAKPVEVKADAGVEAPKVEKTPGIDAIKVNEDGSKSVDLDQARANIRAKIGELPASETKEPSPIAKTKENFNEAYRLIIDRFDPVKRVVDLIEEKTGKVRADLNPFKLLRLLDGSNSVVSKFINEGEVSYSNKTVLGGKSFKSILSTVKGKELRFRDFLIASRVVELETRPESKKNIKTQFNLEEAQAIVDADSKEFKGAADDFYNYQNSVLKYVKDAGILSDEAFEQITEDHKNYISFKNVFDATEDGRAAGSTGSLKKIKGSKRNIQDPFVSSVENTEALVRLAEHNRAKTAFVNLVNKIPGQQLMTKVSSKDLVAVEAKGELASALADHGVENASPESFKIFRASHKDIAENQFEVYEKGQKVRYEIDPSLAKALNGVNADETAAKFIAKYMSAAQKVTKYKKTFISWMPNFQVSNAIRDFTMAPVFSEAKINPGDVLASYADFFKDPKGFIKWLDVGGATGSFVEMDNVLAKENIFNLDKKINFLGKVKNVINDKAEWMAVVARLPQVIESAPRRAEMKKTATKFPKGSLEASVESEFAAREVTLDFSRKGAAVGAYNSLTAYLNVGIQGTDRLVRGLKSNPTDVALRGFAAITVPSLLLWYKQKDDPRYQEIPSWEKHVFWHIVTDDWQPATHDDLMDAANEDNKHLFQYDDKGSLQKNHGIIWRVPMPQGLGILFGSMITGTLDAYSRQNPDAGRDLDEAIKNLLIPNLVPDLPLPLVEQRINEKLFFGGPLIPAHLEGVYGDLQYTNYTSETAKVIGKIVGDIGNVRGGSLKALSSPIVIENYIKSWAGPVGDYALKIADQGLIASGIIKDPVKPGWSVEDIPFVKQFVSRQASGSLVSNQVFEEKVRQIKEAETSLRRLEALGDINAIEKEYGNTETLTQAFSRVKEIEEARSTLRNTIDAVYRDPEIPPDEKRQTIEGMYAQLNFISREGIAAIREAQKEIRQNADSFKHD